MKIWLVALHKNEEARAREMALLWVSMVIKIWGYGNGKIWMGNVNATIEKKKVWAAYGDWAIEKRKKIEKNMQMENHKRK